MKMKIKMSEEELNKLINTIVHDTLDKTFKIIDSNMFVEATVWKWYKENGKPTGDELIKLINNCQKGFKEMQDYIEVQDFFGEGTNED
jgi:hypothetical protein